MINRILIVGKNSAIPRLRDQKVCPDCGGDGWVFGYEINPSAKPFKVTCGCCQGEGFITKSGAAA